MCHQGFSEKQSILYGLTKTGRIISLAGVIMVRQIIISKLLEIEVILPQAIAFMGLLFAGERVCMYKYVLYVCIYVCVYICMFVCLYVCMHVCMIVCRYICIYACMCACSHQSSIDQITISPYMYDA